MTTRGLIVTAFTLARWLTTRRWPCRRQNVRVEDPTPPVPRIFESDLLVSARCCLERTPEPRAVCTGIAGSSPVRATTPVRCVSSGS
jgi:hypothetical protein